jgi:hypothetical protein
MSRNKMQLYLASNISKSTFSMLKHLRRLAICHMRNTLVQVNHIVIIFGQFYKLLNTSPKIVFDLTTLNNTWPKNGLQSILVLGELSFK